MEQIHSCSEADSRERWLAWRSVGWMGLPATAVRFFNGFGGGASKSLVLRGASSARVQIQAGGAKARRSVRPTHSTDNDDQEKHQRPPPTQHVSGRALTTIAVVVALVVLARPSHHDER